MGPAEAISAMITINTTSIKVRNVDQVTAVTIRRGLSDCWSWENDPPRSTSRGDPMVDMVFPYGELYPMGSYTRPLLALPTLPVQSSAHGTPESTTWESGCGAVKKADARISCWCQGAESNRRHQHFQCCALPTELPWRRAIDCRQPRKRRVWNPADAD